MNQLAFRQFLVFNFLGYVALCCIILLFLLVLKYSAPLSLMALIASAGLWIGGMLFLKRSAEKEIQTKISSVSEEYDSCECIDTRVLQIVSALLPVMGWSFRNRPPKFLVEAWELNSKNQLQALIAQVRISNISNRVKVLDLFQSFFSVQLTEDVIAQAVLQMANRFCREIQELEDAILEKVGERAAIDYLRTISDIANVLSEHNVHWTALQRISETNYQNLHSLREQQSKMEASILFWKEFMSQVENHYEGRLQDRHQVMEVVDDVIKLLVKKGKFADT